MSIRSSIRALVVSVAAIGALSGSVLLATGASAGVTPQPVCTPTATPFNQADNFTQPDQFGQNDQFGLRQCLAPTPVPTPVTFRQPLRPEQFYASISTFNPLGTVNAFGPIRGFNGNLIQISPTRDDFRFPFNFRSVREFQTPLPTPVVNPFTCIATVSQTGFWQFLGGTGAYAFARGHGTLFERARFVYPRTITGACPVLRINAGLVRPIRFSITEQGFGVAARS